MKKNFSIICLFMLFLILTLTACGANKSPDTLNKETFTETERNDFEGVYSYDANGTSNQVSPSEIVSSTYERKVIQTVSFEIMAKDPEISYSEIVKYCLNSNGYEFSYVASGYQDSYHVKAVIKLPPNEVSRFTAFLKENYLVTSSQLESVDITDSYYDTETRLTTKRQVLLQYYDLLKKAKGMEEILSVQNIIDGITEEIEALEGRLKVMKSQTDMSTIELVIHQIYEPVVTKKEIKWNTLSFEDMGYLIKKGFFSISNTIVSLLQWLIVIIIGYSPLWIIGGLVLFTLLKLTKPKDLK